ncbi:hypothetical protein KJ975_04665, partial [Myxococcota bacterium]|nr:hypothetical protein [Myxococcota bacterium]
MNKAAFLLVILAMSGCFNDRKNPVKHSGELARRGHLDLYNNGAFRIPATEVKIIPPGSTPLELAKEFIGIKARDGFLMAIKEAAGSVYVLADGARLSLTTAQTITSEGTALANLIRSSTRRDGVIIISRSFAAGIGIIGDSWQLSKDLLAEMKLIGDIIVLSSRDAANAVDRNLTGGGLRMMKNSWVRSALIVRESGQRTKESVTSAYDGFIVGYAVLPALAAADAKSVAKAMKASNPVRIAREENQWRKEYSAYFAKLVTSAGSGYVGSIKTSFANAGRNLGNYRTTGISLASLRAMTWVLKGILYDAVLKPVVKLAVGAVGYIGVNGIAYPVMVVTRTGGNLTYVAVLLTYSA